MGTFPRRARLVAGLEIAPLAEGRLMLRSFSATIVLSGEFVTQWVPQLLPRLDGHHDVADLAELVGPDFRSELEALLQRLQEGGFIVAEAAEVPAADPATLNSREQAYWSLHASSASEAAQRLAAASVIVAGLGGVGATVARALAAAGVGRLTLIDPSTVGEADLGFGFDARDLGQPRAVALAALLDSRATRAEGLDAAIDALSDWDSLVAAAGHVVMCGDTMTLAGYDRANAACIASGTPWLSVRVDRTRAVIGPYVIPAETACFTCFELRNRLNADHPSDEEALTMYRKSTASAKAWPALASLTAAVGQLVSLDLIQVIGGKRLSAALGRVIHLDPAAFQSRHHEVLKLPRCPACSRLRERPMTRIWDFAPPGRAETPPVAAIG